MIKTTSDCTGRQKSTSATGSKYDTAPNRNSGQNSSHQTASKKKVIKKEVTKTVSVPAPESELYVEVNGVKIYNEEEALKITEEVLSLASNNIRKGLEATRNIKYLTIEL